MTEDKNALIKIVSLREGKPDAEITKDQIRQIRKSAYENLFGKKNTHSGRMIVRLSDENIASLEKGEKLKASYLGVGGTEAVKGLQVENDTLKGEVEAKDAKIKQLMADLTKLKKASSAEKPAEPANKPKDSK